MISKQETDQDQRGTIDDVEQMVVVFMHLLYKQFTFVLADECSFRNICRDIEESKDAMDIEKMDKNAKKMWDVEKSL